MSRNIPMRQKIKDKLDARFERAYIRTAYEIIVDGEVVDRSYNINDLAIRILNKSHLNFEKFDTSEKCPNCDMWADDFVWIPLRKEHWCPSCHSLFYKNESVCLSCEEFFPEIDEYVEISTGAVLKLCKDCVDETSPHIKKVEVKNV